MSSRSELAVKKPNGCPKPYEMGLVESHRKILWWQSRLIKKRKTCFTEVTLMKRLWFGEQDISQKIFKKFLKHAGHPTRNGTACKMLTFKDQGVKFYTEHRFRVETTKEPLDHLVCKK